MSQLFSEISPVMGKRLFHHIQDTSKKEPETHDQSELHSKVSKLEEQLSTLITDMNLFLDKADQTSVKQPAIDAKGPEQLQKLQQRMDKIRDLIH